MLFLLVGQTGQPGAKQLFIVRGYCPIQPGSIPHDLSLLPSAGKGFYNTFKIVLRCYIFSCGRKQEEKDCIFFQKSFYVDTKAINDSGALMAQLFPLLLLYWRLSFSMNFGETETLKPEQKTH